MAPGCRFFHFETSILYPGILQRDRSFLCRCRLLKTEDDEANMSDQRLRFEKMRTLLQTLHKADARNPLNLTNCLVRSH
jgi:hypothetical protein